MHTHSEWNCKVTIIFSYMNTPKNIFPKKSA